MSRRASAVLLVAAKVPLSLAPATLPGGLNLQEVVGYQQRTGLLAPEPLPSLGST